MNTLSISSKERLWFSVVMLLILIFSSIPNWVGFASETAELSYAGIFYDPQDYAVHLSMLRAGMQGEWAYQFRFTSEPHTAAYTRLFYLVLGNANRLFRLDPALCFEIARWLFGALALFSLYELVKRVFTEPIWRQTAFLLAVFGSGLGWLQLATGWLPGKITPIDFWLIDAYILFSLSLFPHFSFTIAMLCLSFAFFLDFLRTTDWKRIAWIILMSVLTQVVNPIAFVLVDAALAATAFVAWVRDGKWQWKHAAALAGIATAQLPLLIYNYSLLTNDPIWSQFTKQNQTLSPPPAYYLWGFGLLWLFALIGTIHACPKKEPALLASVAWIVTCLTLVYAPFYIQRRFLVAITMPLALLATLGLKLTLNSLSQKMHFTAQNVRSLSLLAVFLCSISSIVLIPGRSLYLRQHPDEFFYPSSLDPALAWLQNNAAPNDFVLCSASSGLLIAQKTDLRVYLGHEMETLDYPLKIQQVNAFYQGQVQEDWLTTVPVRWVLFGPYEQKPSTKGELSFQNLEMMYQAEGVTIYKVIR